MDRETAPVGLYLHFPFCPSRCTYCDFLTFPHAEKFHAPYVQALCREILATDAGQRADSIFFGGGTPSLLQPEAFDAIAAALHARYVVTPGAEITVECDPGTLTAERMAAWKRGGVNRISLGVQSFSDRLLASVGRRHRRADVLRDVTRLREAGFSNLSFDLLFSLPGQTAEDIDADLEMVAMLRPQHISWYSLIVEEKTLLAYRMAHGEETPQTEEADRAFFARILRGLAASGYRRYEISNFAQPGFASLHNRKYWTGRPYRGYGLGAASYLPKSDRAEHPWRRFANTRILSAYLSRWGARGDAKEDGRTEKVDAPAPTWAAVPASDDTEPGDTPYTLSDDWFDRVMTGLRLVEGFRRAEVLHDFGTDLPTAFPALVHRYEALGHLVVTPETVRMTSLGLDLQNGFLRDLLLAMEEKEKRAGLPL